MKKIDYKLWKKSFPFICTKCGYYLWEKRAICEECGKKDVLRETNKKDYKRWKDDRSN